MKQVKNRYRYSLILLKQLVKTDFKLRYQGSVLGYMWSLLRPLALFSILYVVFVKFIRIGAGMQHYASYLLLGIVLWNFFAEITMGSIGSIVGNGDLLRKINFPRYVIVLSTSVSALINLTFNLAVIVVFMLMQHADISKYAIFAPLLLLELFVFALGWAFLLSAMFVRFRDLSYIWEVILQAGFYATPIIYPFALVYERNMLAAKVLALNPITQIIQDMRYILVTKQAMTIGTLYHSRTVYLIPLTIVTTVFVGFGLYFKSRSKYFAEEV